jgi:hypothetical protein
MEPVSQIQKLDHSKAVPDPIYMKSSTGNHLAVNDAMLPQIMKQRQKSGTVRIGKLVKNQTFHLRFFGLDLSSENKDEYENIEIISDGKVKFGALNKGEKKAGKRSNFIISFFRRLSFLLLKKLFPLAFPPKGLQDYLSPPE